MQMNNLMNMMNNSVLETDLALLRRNAESIMRAIPAGTKLLPVLKCDAYGLGAAEIARVLEPLEAVVGFTVAHVSEGLALRNAGITKDILVMSSALPWQLSAAVEANLTLACGRAGFASELQAAAEAAGKPAAIHIKIDTGAPDRLCAGGAGRLAGRTEKRAVTARDRHVLTFFRHFRRGALRAGVCGIPAGAGRAARGGHRAGPAPRRVLGGERAIPGILP